MNQHFNVRQVSKKLNKSEVTIRRWLKSGHLKGVKLGRDWLIKPEEVSRVLENGL